MSPDSIYDKSANHTEDAVSSRDDDFEQFRRLSYELLKYSNLGLLRKDFLPRVSESLRKHAGCDETEIWVKEGSDKHYRCVVARSTPMPRGFVLVPRPLGEDADPPPPDSYELTMEQLCCAVINGMVSATHPCVTPGGSFRVGNDSEANERHGYAKSRSGQPMVRLPEPFKSIAVIPIRLEHESIGLLQLKSLQEKFLSPRRVEFYEDISTVLGVAVSHQYSQIELRERIKEITCLYGIARVIAKSEGSFDDIVQNIVDLLPPAWLYPEMTCARITLDGRSYTTKGFAESQYRQISDITINNHTIGSVEVAYSESVQVLDEGPFLIEERRLIDSVAREVAVFYKRTKAEAEQALLHEQLRHADRLATIGQLAAGVAHELNEPLGNILGFAQLAKKSPGLPAQVAKDLQSIESASLYAREIIRKLVTFARQLPPRKTPVNFNEVVAEGLSFFDKRCAKSGIRLIRRFAEEVPMITIDPRQINQVLVNLVVNAIQAMPDGGTLTVETRGAEKGLRLIVEDTGIGMEDELTKQIFLPFFTTKDINEGTGLGLSVVDGIVASHGGTIEVETSPGRGAKFTVYLPHVDSEQLDEGQT
jgi:two-component system NtrC family sensor kinase